MNTAAVLILDAVHHCCCQPWCKPLLLIQLPTSGMLSFTAADPLLVRAGAAAGLLLAPDVEVFESATALQ